MTVPCQYYEGSALGSVLSLGSDYLVVRLIKHIFIANLQSIPALLKHIL